jgi:putative MATE family efflux protein
VTPERILKGSPLSTIFYLALPAILVGWIQTAFEIVDALWVSRLGGSEIAILSAATFIIWEVSCVALILNPGLNQQIAFQLGAGKAQEAKALAFNGLLWAFFLGIMIGILGTFLLPFLFDITELKDSLRPRTEAYLKAFFCGLPFLYVFLASLSILRGYGETKTVAFLTFLAFTVNATLDPLFIYAAGYGVLGAVYASLCAISCACFVAVAILYQKKMLCLQKTSRQLLLNILKIGTPLMVNSLIFCSVYLFLTRHIMHFGEAPLSAIGICVRLEGIAYFCALGLGTAATTAIGVQLGAGNLKKALAMGDSAVFLAFLLTLPWAFLLIFYPELLLWGFTQDPEVLFHSTSLLRILGYFEIALCIECTLEGVFAGIGKTFWAGFCALFFTLCRIPFVLCFVFYFQTGVEGIWWAISLSTFLKGLSLTLFWYFYKKRL